MDCYLQLGGWETTKPKLHQSKSDIKSDKINERGTKRTDELCAARQFFHCGIFLENTTQLA